MQRIHTFRPTCGRCARKASGWRGPLRADNRQPTLSHRIIDSRPHVWLHTGNLRLVQNILMEFSAGMFDLGIGIMLLLFGAGVAAGALNAIAGGATFFTFPALILSGLPPLVANATNFIALVPSNIAALPAFRDELKALGRELIAPISVGASGGLIGALALVYLGGDLFASAVPYLMGFATLLFAAAPYIRRVVVRQIRTPSKSTGIVPLILLFGFSIYGGYFGAGLGQIILAALVLNGYDDFHVANALKNGIIAAISLVAVAVYGFSGAVSFPHAIIMMLGATLGGYLGGSMSKTVPQNALRVGVIVFGALLTIYYFYSMS